MSPALMMLVIERTYHGDSKHLKNNYEIGMPFIRGTRM